MKVTTEPPGVEIIHEGKAVGPSPQYIEIRRRKNSELTFRQGESTQSITLKTRYRWGDSLLANGIFFSWLTPVGWGIDYFTGAAWNYQPLSRTKLNGFKILGRNSFYKISIAPPQASHEQLSDEIGERVEAWAKKAFPKGEIQPFKRGVSLFERYDYVFESTTPPELRDDLYSDLASEIVVESSVIDEGSSYRIPIQVTNVFEETSLAKGEVPVKKSDLRFERMGKVSRFLSSTASFLPNTLGVDFSDRKPSIEVEEAGKNIIKAQNIVSSDVLTYLSSISLRTLSAKYFKTQFGFTFNWTTEIVLSYSRFRFVTSEPGQPNPYEDTRYNWYQMLGGIGPQVGITTPVGFFYLEAVPVFGGSWVNWEKGGNHFEVNSAVLAARWEFGYLFFISRNFNVRIAGAVLSANESQWSDVAQRSVGAPRKISSPSSISGGISIGYFFPESKQFIKSILF